MKSKLISKILMVATPLVIVCGLLAFGASARSDSSDSEGRSCSNQTLRGDYGFSIEGLVLPAPGVALPLRGVSMAHFDGQGNFTQVDHVVVNGNPPALDWTPSVGTYTVNSDCTGTARVDFPSSGNFLNLRLVVVRNGKEIHDVVTAPFRGPALETSAVGIRVD